MTAKEAGFLLLTSHLGDPARHPLTVAQFRVLANNIAKMEKPLVDRELEAEDLFAIGCSQAIAERILLLLSQTQLLRQYITDAQKTGCKVLTRISRGYPGILRRRLDLDSPGCIWAKGELEILGMKKLALVGSRDLNPENRAFAAEVGRQAAMEGYALVSGNARGADREGQNSCLAHGGKVISIVADSLVDKPCHAGVLYLSENSHEEAFSSQRAHSRNRLIHALGDVTFVAQSGMEKGGTWSGSIQNLRNGWSPVCIFDDGSPAVKKLTAMGAKAITVPEIQSYIKRI